MGPAWKYSSFQQNLMHIFTAVFYFYELEAEVVIFLCLSKTSSNKKLKALF